uniref:acetyl-CoA carboxylase carboxyltransferase beta subunit n=1 Tax=Dapsilanthus disjunctus TaxID=2919630 RepID=UPI001F12ED86|nr:acetyl-CoA carboxylase carboxyltransferase beta subunit [Dapsilanthus disjunctus]ULQ65086.1 acetyl-CoA carboxylase carboxyltransferase beta subunit [Dapsilanthus disjunctus]ULQ65174.1 acetyl-CoA carboxylase carboxyltransferase beta subunit [Dapsilanthus disjunctus]
MTRFRNGIDLDLERKTRFLLPWFPTCRSLSTDKYNWQFGFRSKFGQSYWDNRLDTREWFFDWPNWNRLGPIYKDCLFMGQISQLADQTQYEFLLNGDIHLNENEKDPDGNGKDPDDNRNVPDGNGKDPDDNRNVPDGNGKDPDDNGEPDPYFTSEGVDSSSNSSSFAHFWVQCDFCYTLTHHKTFKSEMGLCAQCESHLKMKSSDRLELLVDVDTWHSFDEEMVSIDPIEFDFEDGLGLDLKEDPLDLNLEEDELGVDWVDLDFFESSYFPSEEDELDPKEGGLDLNFKEAKLKFDSEEDELELDLDSEGDEFDLDLLDFDSEEDNLGFDSLDFPFEEDELDSKEDELELDLDYEEDKFELDSEEEDKPYKDRLDSYQKETGLPDAIQTGIGQLKSLSIAIGVMDFQFIGGSMGSVVGEKITCLIEHATNRSLPLIILCASGGARMQEGGLSLMQMGKISSVLNKYLLITKNKNIFYVSILTTPTTGGVTASFGMLGDIVIAEPDAYIAFAGKRVIEETLHVEVPEGLQETEYLFEKGSFDLVVPRNLLKGVLIELYSFHDLLPFNVISN